MKYKEDFDLQAVVLAGGLGTRLRSVVSDRPKVLAPIGAKPFLRILLEQLIEAGFESVVLCCGYMADAIEQRFGQKYDRLRIFYSKEPQPLGTAGAIRYAVGGISGEFLLVMNGDSYVDVDLRGFVDWFFSERRKAGLVLSWVGDAERYGCVEVDEQGRIVSFCEKGSGRRPGWINAGVYLFCRGVFEVVPEGVMCSLEREVLPGLIADGLYGFKSNGMFIDIGTPESYGEAKVLLAQKSSLVKCHGGQNNDNKPDAF